MAEASKHAEKLVGIRPDLNEEENEAHGCSGSGHLRVEGCKVTELFPHRL